MSAPRVSEQERNAKGELTAGELERRHQAVLDAQPMTTRCAIDGCDWSYEGTAGYARAEAQHHRETAHAAVRPLTKAERKEREIEEARARRTERDAAQRSNGHAGLEALARMDAGEPQAPSATREWSADAAVAAIRSWAAEHGRFPTAAEFRDHADPDYPTYKDVRAAFPEGWVAALKAAGCPTHVQSNLIRVAPDGTVTVHDEEPAVAPTPPAPDPVSRAQPWTREEAIAAIQRWAETHDGQPPTANGWRKKTEGYPNLSTVARLFGSWADGIEAAGYPRPTRGGPAAPAESATSAPPGSPAPSGLGPVAQDAEPSPAPSGEAEEAPPETTPEPEPPRPLAELAAELEAADAAYGDAYSAMEDAQARLDAAVEAFKAHGLVRELLDNARGPK